MEERQMKNIIENCSDHDFQQLEEMVKKEREKRDGMLEAEVNIMLIKIKGLIHDIEERGFVVTYGADYVDAESLSWEWYKEE